MLFKKTKSRRRKVTSELSHSFEKLEPRNLLAAVFSSFSVTDGSLDNTSNTTLESSSLSLSYDVNVTAGSLTNVQVFASEGSDTRKIGEYSSLDVTNGAISLDGFSGLAGTQQIFAIASTSDGETATSSSVAIDVLPTSLFSGDFTADTFNYSGGADSAYVYHGKGGTDTLSLNVNQSAVTGLNGQALSAYDRDALVTSQAFYNGTVYDYLTLDSGREIYLQGIERLEFSNGSVVDLTTRPNDPIYDQQWEHAIGDVADAWKFTRGSDEVLVVSLDNGTRTVNGTPVVSSDIDISRFEWELPEPNNGGDHGHASFSVMAEIADNGIGIAGINQDSPLLVADLYQGYNTLSINDIIQIAEDKLANSSIKRVVFQGGIQGEYWLNTNSLDQTLLSDNLETMLFAIASGNGGQDISLTSNPVYSGGVARLEGTFENVMAIGAMEPTTKQNIHGLDNATAVNLASYSNFGANQTFAVSTLTRYMGIDGGIGTFSGTSNANPIMAGFSSLVWSVNTDLTAGEVRQIFADTVQDLGTPGRDTTYGHGTPDAGAAVRRAWALSQNPILANLSTNAFAGSGDAVTSVGDNNSGANTVAEDASAGTTVGITAYSDDSDSGDTVTYQLLDSAAGLFGINATTGVVTVVGALDFESATSHTIMVQSDSSDGSSTFENFSIAVTNVNDAVLVGRDVFYLGSSFDDGAIGAVATDKAVLFPGQTATFSNYTSYIHGINGFVIDVQALNSAPTLGTVGDYFEFSVGNDNNPSGWAAAPAPTGLTYAADVDGNGTDRIYLEWDDNAIQNTWLEIRALSNASTGLPGEDAFYIGNAIAETGNDPTNTRVNLADIGGARSNQTAFTGADIDNNWDFDRDGRVNLADIGFARSNQTAFTTLNLITPPSNDNGQSNKTGFIFQSKDKGFESFALGESRFKFDSELSFETGSFEPAVMSDDLSLAGSLLSSRNDEVTVVEFENEVESVRSIDSDQLKQLDSVFSVELP